MILKDSERFPEALEKYEKAIFHSQKNQKLVYKLHYAQLLYKMEQYDRAELILNDLIQNSKPESTVYFLLGKTLAKMGRLQDAQGKKLIKKFQGVKMSDQFWQMAPPG